MTESPRKIAVVQIGKIGDLILLEPLIRELKNHFPAASVYVIASKRNSIAIPLIAGIDGYIIYEKGVCGIIKTRAKIRKEKFDLWIDPKDHFSRESAMLASFARATASIGFKKDDTSRFTMSLPKEATEFENHRVQQNLNALLPLGIASVFSQPKIFDSSVPLPDSWRTPAVTINISAGTPLRILPVDFWVTVVRGIQQLGLTCGLLAAPQQRADAESITAKAGCAFFVGSFMQACRIIQESQLLVTPDTASAHIAAGYNVPIVGLYSSAQWNINRFRPLSSDAYLVLAPEGEEIALIEPQAVVDAVAAMHAKLSKQN